MTNKDLNLAMDKHLIQPEDDTPSSRQNRFNNANFSATEPDDPAHREESKPRFSDQQTNKKPYQNKASLFPRWLTDTKQPFLWLSVALVSVNLVFLLIAGIWLSGLNYQTTGEQNRLGNATNKQFSNKLTSLDEQITEVQQRLDQLALSIREQQQLIANSANDLNKELETLTSGQAQLTNMLKLKAENTAAIDAASKDKTPISPPAPKKWHVNLGTFSTKEAAVRLQKQLLALGHSVQVNSASIENKTAYRVQLPGFKDRESAERVAKQIMDKTRLNGLWAWKDE
jgi:cell division septation protein DedD